MPDRPFAAAWVLACILVGIVITAFVDQQFPEIPSLQYAGVMTAMAGVLWLAFEIGRER